MIRTGEIFYAWATDPDIREAGSSGGFVTGILMHLLETGVVDAVSVVRQGADIYDAEMSILSDPEKLRLCSGSLYCGTLSSAKFIFRYLQGKAEQRLAVVVKGCEAKAIIELAKRNQIDLDNILLIGLNCSGTINPFTARRMATEKYGLDPDLVQNIFFSQGRCMVQTPDEIRSISIEELEQEGYGRRHSCQRCLTRIPRQCDLVCGDWGVIGDYTGNTTCIEVCSRKGAEALESSIHSGHIRIEAADPKGVEVRARVEDAMQVMSKKNRTEQFSDIVSGDQILQQMTLDMSRCIKCYQCTEACPLCICEDCRIKKPWLVKPGQVPPPFMFHLIRVSHIADSCINCGQCEDRCPMEIPNSRYMNALQVELELMFGYH
ncbi:MAG: Coenzyme F420 hydrogenase/dehydrogenase, beta subunit C-terminal domain, partial [Methanospirillum sp.]|uniref:Coenzyme F420 hydrogenase/dehydrogenase, beta subunit C-terminal domain n=1 Tax=Methanospirillum sp. TaxID=45200 RepID=UPI0023750BB4